jgi:hypothetical protein
VHVPDFHLPDLLVVAVVDVTVVVVVVVRFRKGRMTLAGCVHVVTNLTYVHLLFVV